MGTDDRRVGRQEQCRMELPSRQRDDTFDVTSCTISIFDGGTRSATRRSRTARLMARKQSTCGTSRRRRSLGNRKLDAARGDEHRSRRRRGTESAVAAIATAFGSWACTTSGRSCRHTRQAPGSGEIDLASRRQRHEVESLRHALEERAVRPRQAPRADRSPAAPAPCNGPGSARRATSSPYRRAGKT